MIHLPHDCAGTSAPPALDRNGPQLNPQSCPDDSSHVSKERIFVMRLHFLLSDKTYTQPRRPPRYRLDPQVAGVPQNISGTLQTLLQKLWWRFTAKSCPTLETPWAVACQAPLCPFPGIFQAQILERVTISSSRGSS